MCVVRVKKTENFVILSKEALEHPELSFKAKGLWAYCMSRPNDWEFKLAHLVTVSKEGREAVSSALKELELAGYCKKVQLRSGGKFGPYDYEMYETSELKKCLPQTGFPLTGKPLTGNPPLLSIEEETKKRKDTKRKPLARRIILNETTKQFEGITDEDIKNWQEAHPAVNVRKELLAARIWALDAPRKNYRKSLNTWMGNKNESHTTPFKTQIKGIQEIGPDEVKKNSELACSWENEFKKRGVLHYDVQEGANKVHFIMPNDESYSVDYLNTTEGFLKECQKAIKRMGLKMLSQKA